MDSPVESVDNAKKPNLMVALLEQSLDAAAVPGSDQAPVVMCIVMFENNQLEGAVKRGPLPGTYVLAQQLGNRNPNTGEMIPIPGKIVEIAFAGDDIVRLAHVREIDPALLAPDSGPRIWTPGGGNGRRGPGLG